MRIARPDRRPRRHRIPTQIEQVKFRIQLTLPRPTQRTLPRLNLLRTPRTNLLTLKRHTRTLRATTKDHARAKPKPKSQGTRHQNEGANPQQGGGRLHARLR